MASGASDGDAAADGSDGSDSQSSLGSFGAALEEELLQAAADAPAGVEPAAGAPLPADADAEPASKRQRADDARGAAAAAPGNAAAPAAICPPHPGFLHGMCIRCCARKEERSDSGDEGEAHVPMTYISAGLELRETEMSRLRADEQRRVLASRKLFLILDLDHTLLNSARVQEIEAASLEQLQAMTLHELDRPGGPELYELRYMRMWTKLRPGARALLAGAAPLAEILVYTMGDRAYAVEMARLLDPSGNLLRQGRLISAPDSRTSGLKDLDVVLGAAEGVLILDDTPGVWRRHADNVITAERYHFFPSSARGHGGDGAHSWLANSRDEDEADGVLAALLRVIKRVHTAFFDPGEAGARVPLEQRDVRPMLRTLRSEVLRGCVLLFSHVIPLGDAAPERHVLWRTAVELGAVCAIALGDGVTHVVAGHSGTDKVRWASKHGVHCVSPAWLRSCAARWERMPEQGFAVASKPADAAAASGAAT